MSAKPQVRESENGEPRTMRGRATWPGAVSLLVIGVVYAVLRDNLRVAPSYLLLALVAVMIPPIFYAQLWGRYHLSHLLGLALVILATAAMGTSILLLVVDLSTRPVDPAAALRDAGLIWLANPLTFAVWYWEIDEGGPGKRRSDNHKSLNFQIPQDQNDSSGWSPDFTDYLYLTITTNMTFGPTDTAVLSKRAKVLTIVQKLFSLLMIAVVVARATAQ